MTTKVPNRMLDMGYADVQAYGAKGDGVTDDSSAFVSALFSGKSIVRVPYTADGYNLGTTMLTIDSGVMLTGENMVKLKSQSTHRMFKMTGQGVLSGIQNVTIDMTGSGASSSAIRYATSEGYCQRSLLKNIVFENCVEAIGEDEAGTYIFEHVWEDIKCNYPRGRQIYSRNSRGFIYLNRVDVDCTLSATPTVTWESIAFNNFIGVFLDQVTVTGQNVAHLVSPGYQAGAIGIKFDGDPAAGFRHIWLKDVRVESSCGPGIQCLDTTFINAVNLEAFACLGLPLYFEDCNYIQGSMWGARGANDLTGGAATSHGLSFVDCTKVFVNGIRSGQNTGDGVLVNNSTDVELTNVFTESNTGASLTEAGTSNYNTYRDLRSYDDGALPTILGAQSAIAGKMIDNVRSRGTSAICFRAHRNAVDQTAVTPATFQKVVFTHAEFNVGGHYNTTSTRFQPPPGRYRISASCLVAAANVVAGSEYVMLIYKNGVATGGKVGPTVRAQSIASLGLQVTGLFEANGTDFFEVYVYLGGAGNKTISGDAAYTTFEGEEI